MKILISAAELDYNPQLVETDSCYRTIYGSDTKDFDNFEDALEEFKNCCLHSAECMGMTWNGED